MRLKNVGLIASLALGILLTPFPADAQQPPKIPRIGFLTVTSLPALLQGASGKAFRQGLRDVGYVEGQNIAIEFRSAEGQVDGLPGLATDLVRLKVDVIVAVGSDAIRATQQATKTIPIVMAVSGDPVGAGLVASLARPGGNITGLASLAAGIAAKRLELLKEALPRLTRVAVLANPANPSHAPTLKGVEAAARSLGMHLEVLQVREPKTLDEAFSTITRAGAGGLLVLADTMLADQQERILHLAARSRLPDISEWREFPEAGGFMSYGASRPELYRRAAYFVDKILKGAKPADLPVEQPTKFELVINMKTAKALGLTIPQSLLLRADQIIE